MGKKCQSFSFSMLISSLEESRRNLQYKTSFFISYFYPNAFTGKNIKNKVSKASEKAALHTYERSFEKEAVGEILPVNQPWSRHAWSNVLLRESLMK